MAVLFSVALCNSMYALYALLLYIAKFNVENVDQNPSNGDMSLIQNRTFMIF